MKLKAKWFIEHRRCTRCGELLKGSIKVVLDAVVGYDVDQFIQSKPGSDTEFYCEDCGKKL